MNRATDDMSRQEPDLKENYIFRLIYEFILFAVPLITTPYISRVLCADGVGDFSYAYSVTTYFMMFSVLGMVSYGTREIARNRDDKAAYSRLFWEIRLITMIPGVVCLLLWGVLIALAPGYRLIYMALTPYLLGSLFDISWFFTGIERIKGIVIAGAAVRIIGVILMFVMVNDKEDVAMYCAINASIVLVSNLIMWMFLPKYLVKVSLKGIRTGVHLKELFIYFIPSAAISVYLVLDKTLIGLITGDPYQNGYYEQADRIIAVSKLFVFGVLNIVATARMSYLYAMDKKDEIAATINRSMDYILLLGYGAVFGLIGISSDLVPVFFGRGYEPVEGYIYLMLPIILIAGVSSCLESHYFIPSGKREQSAKYIVAGVFANFVLNICLIPLYGALGAIAATLAAELLIAVLFVLNCGGCVTGRKLLSLSVKRIVAGIIMTGSVKTLGYLPVNAIAVLLLQLICGALVYGLVLLILKDRMAMELKAQSVAFVRSTFYNRCRK